MPTNGDETVQERYQREADDYRRLLTQREDADFKRRCIEKGISLQESWLEESEARRRKCEETVGHDYEVTGTYKIPGYGKYYTDMPMEPTGMIEYENLVCKLCGATLSREVLFSYNPNNQQFY